MVNWRSQRKQQAPRWARLTCPHFPTTVCVILQSSNHASPISVCTGTRRANRITFSFFLYKQSAEFYLGKPYKMNCFANSRSQRPEGLKYRKKCPFPGLSRLVVCARVKTEHSPSHRLWKQQFSGTFFSSSSAPAPLHFFSLEIPAGSASTVPAHEQSWSFLNSNSQTIKYGNRIPSSWAMTSNTAPSSQAATEPLDRSPKCCGHRGW